MTDIVDVALAKSDDSTLQSAQDFLEYHRQRASTLKAMGWTESARKHEAKLEDARTRLADARVDNPQTAPDARLNQRIGRLSDSISESEADADTDTTADTSSKTSQSHRGIR